MSRIVYKKDVLFAHNHALNSPSHSQSYQLTTTSKHQLQTTFRNFQTSPCLTTSPLSTTVSARMASPTAASAPASSLTARLTPMRLVSRAERPLAAAAVEASRAPATTAATTSPLSMMVFARMESPMAVSRETTRYTCLDETFNEALYA